MLEVDIPGSLTDDMELNSVSERDSMIILD